jgi:hypothetical protein
MPQHDGKHLHSALRLRRLERGDASIGRLHRHHTAVEGRRAAEDWRNG